MSHLGEMLSLKRLSTIGISGSPFKQRGTRRSCTLYFAEIANEKTCPAVGTTGKKSQLIPLFILRKNPFDSPEIPSHFGSAYQTLRLAGLA